MTDLAASTPSTSPVTGPIVIIGGGHAAAQLVGSLVEAGLGARVHLVSDEPMLPYQRPPLSKGFLKNAEEQPALIRQPAWYAEQGITLHLGDAAVAIDRAAHTVTLASGTTLPYARLVLATGARARRLSGWPAQLDNVIVLRNAADAERARAQLAAAESVTVLGGGFIGLEIAATARGLGKAVTVIEAAPRLLARAVSPELSEAVLVHHRQQGSGVLLDTTLETAEFEGTRIAALHVGGQRLPVDCLVLGIGADAEDALARDAGLVVDGGVVVDAHQRTSDPDILAVGDCTRFPAHSRTPVAAGHAAQLRLESVANANEQARTAAATLLGRDEPYQALPWFWSEQGTLRLQMAGLLPPAGAHLQTHRRPGANESSFSLFHYLGEALVCVESANAPMDHMMARRLLEAGKHPAPAQVVDTATPLKNLL